MDKGNRKKIESIKNQLDSIIEQIQIERNESKEDETNVLDELMMKKSMLELEIEELSKREDNKDKKSSKIYVLKQGKEIKKIQLVSENKVNSNEGLISDKSPLALALKKARVGETLKISTPIGETKYIFLSLE